MNGWEITYLLRKTGSGVNKLAEKIGVTGAAVSMVIHGRRKIAWIAEKIAAEIGIRPETVFPWLKE